MIIIGMTLKLTFLEMEVKSNFLSLIKNIIIHKLNPYNLPIVKFFKFRIILSKIFIMSLSLIFRQKYMERI